MPENSTLQETLASLIAEHGEDAVTAAMDAAEDAARVREFAEQYPDYEAQRARRLRRSDPDAPRTVPAIRGYLLADLAEWPAPFRRRLEPWIRSLDADRWSHTNAQRALRSFEQGREGDPEAALTPGGCGCGCSGRNNGLAWHLRDIRFWAKGLHEAKARSNRARCREHLDEAKTHFLAWMWSTGQRSVDRLQLGQHAVDAAKHELEELAQSVGRERETVAYLCGRLAVGLYEKGKKKGQPLSRRTREDFERQIARNEAWIAEHTARAEALAPMLAQDVPALVRDFTRCDRGATFEIRLV